MLRVSIAALLALAAVAACKGSTGPNVPPDATIALDREPIALPAAYVGTQQSETVQVLNEGRHVLTISSVSLVGADGGALDRSFGAASYSDPLPAQVAGLGTGFIAFAYQPTKAGKTAAKLLIESDAPARPHLAVDVTACAVAVDAGPDGGC
jgi:hypothetical protein